MQIWLDQVREEPFDWDETKIVAPETLDRSELVALSPVRWKGQVSYVDPGYLLRGRLSYDQTLGCNRCLKPIVEHVEPEVELLILEEDEPGASGEQELQERELGVVYVDGEVLETDPILLEQLQLNIPMKPLCQENCRGLCPVCGTDRNTGSCSCEEKAPDPRWAALAAIKSRLDGEER